MIYGSSVPGASRAIYILLFRYTPHLSINPGRTDNRVFYSFTKWHIYGSFKKKHKLELYEYIIDSY